MACGLRVLSRVLEKRHAHVGCLQKRSQNELWVCVDASEPFPSCSHDPPVSEVFRRLGSIPTSWHPGRNRRGGQCSSHVVCILASRNMIFPCLCATYIRSLVISCRHGSQSARLPCVRSGARSVRSSWRRLPRKSALALAVPKWLEGAPRLHLQMRVPANVPGVETYKLQVFGGWRALRA